MKRNQLGFVVAILLGSMLFNFSTSAHEFDQNDPANPDASVPGFRYQPVITDYQYTVIQTKPANWRELNDRAEKIGGPRGQLRSVTEPIRKRKNKN